MMKPGTRSLVRSFQFIINQLCKSPIFDGVHNLVDEPQIFNDHQIDPELKHTLYFVARQIVIVIPPLFDPWLFGAGGEALTPASFHVPPHLLLMLFLFPSLPPPMPGLANRTNKHPARHQHRSTQPQHDPQSRKVHARSPPQSAPESSGRSQQVSFFRRISSTAVALFCFRFANVANGLIVFFGLEKGREPDLVHDVDVRL